jgi:hypothetical protein
VASESEAKQIVVVPRFRSDERMRRNDLLPSLEPLAALPPLELFCIFHLRSPLCHTSTRGHRASGKPLVLTLNNSSLAFTSF